jgi:hypothetical protein
MNLTVLAIAAVSAVQYLSRGVSNYFVSGCFSLASCATCESIPRQNPYKKGGKQLSIEPLDGQVGAL